MAQSIIVTVLALVGWTGYIFGLISGKVYTHSRHSSSSSSYSFSDYPIQFIFENVVMGLGLAIFTAVAVYMWKQYYKSRSR